MVDPPIAGRSPVTSTDEVVRSPGLRDHTAASDVDSAHDPSVLAAARTATRNLLEVLARSAPPTPAGDRGAGQTAGELLAELARLSSLIAVLAATGSNRSAPDVERAAAALARALVEHGKEIAHDTA